MALLLIILALALLSAVHALCYLGLSSRRQTNFFAQLSMLSITLLAFASPLWVSIPTTHHWNIALISGLHLSIDLRYDTLTWAMLCLVGFVSLIIHSYTARYLLSDNNQNRFMAQLSLLTFSVMLLAMSGSLLTTFIAWQFVGLNLYLLLNHYHYDKRANKAAKKKFIINRVGDICFLLAVLIALHHYGTTRFDVLLQAKTQPDDIVLGLIFIAIMTKSAQFPFHIWLIDTMEAPTPVSALMHAGVINSGGFLLARLSILYDQTPALLTVIFIVGFITALLGKYFMKAQADIKKQLAYSTMGQMGYMVMQCGVGSFASAVFHLIAHGFFKASLFLSSGDALQHANQSPAIAERRRQPTNSYKLISVIITLVLIGLGYSWLTYRSNVVELNPFLWLFTAISLFQLTYQILTHSHTTKIKCISMLLISSIYAVYLNAVVHFNILLSADVAERQFLSLGWWLSIVLLVSILFSLLLQRYLPGSYCQWLMTKLYITCFCKGDIEYRYRRYLINPLRRWGDILLASYRDRSPLTRRITLIILSLLLLLTTCYFLIKPHTQLMLTYQLLIGINEALLVIVLIIANRVASLERLLVTLVWTSLVLINIALGLGQRSTELIGVFQLINNLLPLAVFALLLFKRHAQPALTTLIHNRLPWCHFYMSVFLLLLIGIPGTASFIGEFYLLAELLQIHIILVIAIGVALLLLTLVVLHTLQVHFFNPRAIRQHAIVLSPFLHGIAWLAIGFNVYNGLFPATLLQALSSVITG